jgi:type IV secretory pathway VirB3-like protein
MVGSIGMPELIILLTVSMIWAVPLAVAVWAVVTLSRLRTDQQAMKATLESIERDLRR